MKKTSPKGTSKGKDGSKDVDEEPVVVKR